MNSNGNRVLYDGKSTRTGHRIRVTTRTCTADTITYPISELGHLGLTRGPHGRPPLAAAAGLATALCVLLGAGVAIAVGSTKPLWRALLIAALATVAVTALPSLAATVLRRPYQIWARHRGQPVLLFATHDREQHGQVARALLRATELAQD